MKALLAARALVRRLERPWERMSEFVWQQPILKICMKTAHDLKLFQHMTAKPQSTAELAKATSCDPELLARLLRVLTCGAVIEEADVGQWSSNTFSAALRDPEGIARGIDHYYDVGAPQTARTPGFLKSIGYRNPSSLADVAFKYNMQLEKYEGDWWTYLNETNPIAGENFNVWLSSVRTDSPAWTTEYPVAERVERGWNPETPLVVDVAGGLGRDASYIANLYPKATIVLQDRPDVLAKVAERGEVAPTVTLMPHDFFKAQPVRGARVYFLHQILHDWPDAEAREILLRIRDVMTPGYSKILLYEHKMPERARDTTLIQAVMDINMMAHYASLERTEEQWHQLLESVGLKFVEFFPFTGRQMGIIEVELAS